MFTSVFFQDRFSFSFSKFVEKYEYGTTTSMHVSERQIAVQKDLTNYKIELNSVPGVSTEESKKQATTTRRC